MSAACSSSRYIWHLQCSQFLGHFHRKLAAQDSCVASYSSVPWTVDTSVSLKEFA